MSCGFKGWLLLVATSKPRNAAAPQNASVRFSTRIAIGYVNADCALPPSEYNCEPVDVFKTITTAFLFYESQYDEYNVYNIFNVH
jgi:hypothetical protein